MINLTRQCPCSRGYWHSISLLALVAFSFHLDISFFLDFLPRSSLQSPFQMYFIPAWPYDTPSPAIHFYLSSLRWMELDSQEADLSAGQRCIYDYTSYE